VVGAFCVIGRAEVVGPGVVLLVDGVVEEIYRLLRSLRFRFVLTRVPPQIGSQCNFDDSE